MQRRLSFCCPFLTASVSLHTSQRFFYDKIREKREQSDDGPGDMFYEFPKNPSSNRVPEEFHKTNADAVGAAEKLQRCFLLAFIIVVPIALFGGLVDPFNDGFHRPEGYGTHGVGARHIGEEKINTARRD
ncbi:uncharacterized protein TM35_000062190 [Trypanosoma theileri]|uniref:Transmembrane protein n=1 Tax=Trypanosoma theileri TaxID=67003 RepID=A0A1X0P2P5_9TRYP|nr:uncharacterized protein TM35_000062190 [Trypanosoma theileri]ORC91214.1 hypothetical protein TM35_000062190 [Trypanosoma theileri]